MLGGSWHRSKFAPRRNFRPPETASTIADPAWRPVRPPTRFRSIAKPRCADAGPEVVDKAGTWSVARSRILRVAARIAPFVRSVIENGGSLHPVDGAALPEAIGGIAVRRAG